MQAEEQLHSPAQQGHGTSPPAAAGFSCDTCLKTFARLDHVRRHKESHTNDRRFPCPDCPRKFNRLDLLSRHEKIHRRRPNKEPPRRVTQACAACISAKARCDEIKPCSRCRLANRECSVAADPKLRSPASRVAVSANQRWTHAATPPAATTPVLASTSPALPCSLHSSASQVHPDRALCRPLDFGAEEFHGFSAQLSPTFFQTEHSFGMGFDFNFPDFALIADDLFTPKGSPLPSVQSNNGDNPRSHQLWSSGDEAFRQSPWIWNPTHEDSSFAENEALNIDEARAASLPEIEQAWSGLRLEARSLEPDARDQLLAMVIRSSKVPATSLRSFPSTKVLNGLYQTYFYRAPSQTAKWIHASSFDPSDCPVEFIGAIVASGAQLIPDDGICKMGLALLESVRLSIDKSINKDNTLSRNLRLLQAYRLWLDVALWSGSKRKMTISEANGDIIITRLRRTGVFRAPYYQSLAIEGNLDGEELRSRWMQWVGMESTKRLAFHTLVHDAQCSAAFARPPSVNIVEYTLPLPAATDLWLAPTATNWGARYSTSHGIPSLAQVLENPSILETIEDQVDVALVHAVILHGFWAYIWNYHSARAFPFGAGQRREVSSDRWQNHQYQELSRNLKTLRGIYSNIREQFAAELLLVAELFLMHLQICFSDLQRVAGQAGKQEAQQTLTTLHRQWYNTREARSAIWHASQVLHAASALRLTTLRDFYAVAVYQAGLCLWVYGFVGCMESTGLGTHEGLTTLDHGTEEPKLRVILGGEESTESRSFIDHGRGIPYLSMSTKTGSVTTVPIADQKAIMEAARDTLRRNFPSASRMPPLLENLSSLMAELGDLARSVFNK